MFENQYISLEKVAAQVKLPQKFIREQAEAGMIPHLVVGGRLRFHLETVQVALDRLAKKMISGGGDND